MVSEEGVVAGDGREGVGKGFQEERGGCGAVGGLWGGMCDDR